MKKKHKCCRGRSRGQILEFEFLDLKGLLRNHPEGLICLGTYKVTRSTYLKRYKSQLFVPENDGDIYELRRQNQSNQSSIPSYQGIIKQGTSTVLTADNFKDSLASWIWYKKDACNTRLKYSSRSYQDPFAGNSSISDLGQTTIRKKCEPISTHYTYTLGGAGTSISCSQISSLLGQNLAWSSHTDTEKDKSVDGAVIDYERNTFTVLEGATGGLFKPAEKEPYRPIPRLKLCKVINVSREVWEQGFIFSELGDRILIKDLNNEIEYYQSIPEGYKFMSVSYHECGCAKGEIQCLRDGKSCCIDCCEVMEKLHNKYSEVYG